MICGISINVDWFLLSTGGTQLRHIENWRVVSQPESSSNEVVLGDYYPGLMGRRFGLPRDCGGRKHCPVLFNYSVFGHVKTPLRRSPASN